MSRMESPASSMLSSMVVLPMRLDHDGDRAGLGVGIGNGQGDALPAIIQPHDDKLPGPLLARDARSLDHKQLDASRQGTRFHDLEHRYPPP